MALNFPDSPTLNQVYTDSNSGFSYQWDGVVWKSYTPSASSQIKILDDISGSFDGVTNNFPITISGNSFTPANAQQLRIVLGGIVQEPIADYVVSGDTIAFTTAPTFGLSFSGVSLGPALPAVGIASTGTVYVRQQYSPTGVQTTFTFTSGYTPGFLDVYQNGSKLVSGDDFTATDGSVFDLTTPAQSGDDVEAVGFLITDLYTFNGVLGTLTVAGNGTVAGILTAGSFVGNLSGNATSATTATTATNTAYAATAGIATNAQGLTGTPDITVRNIVGVGATFTGNVSIAGTITYEDVTNVDSVGLVTAREGIRVTGGYSKLTGVLETVSAATTYMSGSDLVLEFDVQNATSYTYTNVGGNVGIVSFKNMPADAQNGTTITLIHTQNSTAPSGIGNTTATSGIGTNCTVVPYVSGSPIAGISTRGLVGSATTVTLSSTENDVDFVSFFVHYTGGTSSSADSYKIYVTKNGGFQSGTIGV